VLEYLMPDAMRAIPFFMQLAGGAMAGYAGWQAIQTLRPGMTLQDYLRHIYCIGRTGTGKTTKLRNMFVRWISEGRGGLWIELKDRQDAIDLLNTIPPEHIGRVIFHDPYSQADNPIGLNILGQGYGLRTVRTLVGGETVSIFKRIWPNAIMASSEDIIRNTTLAALDAGPDSTVLEVYRMVKDQTYREAAVDSIRNPVLRDYFANDFPDPGKNTQMFNPPLNKERSFLTDDLLLHILGQSGGLDPGKIIAENKILIACYPKGLLGEAAARLLASVVLSKFQLALMARAAAPRDSRTPYILCLDEFQDYCNASINVLLEQGRALGASVVLSHQLTSQIPEDLLKSILGNIGSVFCFRIGVNDAPILAKEFRQYQGKPKAVEPYREQVLQNLRNYWCVAKKTVSGRPQRPALEQSEKPLPMYNHAAAIMETSVRDYGVPAILVKADIERRLSRTVQVGDAYAD
jgi:hypothetical protein